MVLSGLLLQRLFARTVLTLLFSAAPICLRAAGPDEVAGTMPEDYLPELKAILAHAMKRNPEMLARDFERVIQEAQVTKANAARLPNLGGNFDYGVSQTAVSSSNSSRSRSTGAQYNFSAGQALFHWGAIKNDIEIAKLDLRIGSKETARLYRETSMALRKAYLALVVQKARVRQAREGLQLVRDELEVTKIRKAEGLVAAAVLSGDELRLRENEYQVARLVSDFENNLRSLARVAGLPELLETSLPADIPLPPNPEPLAAAISARTARDNARGTLEWEIYDEKLRQAELRQKIANVRLYPKFGLGAGYSQRNNTSVNGSSVSQEAVTEQRIAISGNWNIFDGFATSGEKRQALAGRRLLEHKKQSEIEEIVQSVQQLERALKLDIEQLKLAEVRHGIALNGLEITKEGVELGDLPKADLRRGEVGILAAYATNLELRAQVLMHWAELVSTAGADPVLKNLPDRNARK